MAQGKRCRYCGETYRVVKNVSTGRWVPLLDATARPTDPRALVLIGSVAYSNSDRVSAVTRVADMFAESEAAAADRLEREYTWHLTHHNVCPNAHLSRKTATR